MKTKVLVVPVNLGFTIDDIINTDLTQLTKESQDQLNKAVNIAKAIQEVKDQKNAAAIEKKTKAQAILDKVYDDILASGNTGHPLSAIKETIFRADLSLSVLTTKLKCLLKERLPNHDLEKVKRNNVQYYKFISLD